MTVSLHLSIYKRFNFFEIWVWMSWRPIIIVNIIKIELLVKGFMAEVRKNEVLHKSHTLSLYHFALRKPWPSSLSVVSVSILITHLYFLGLTKDGEPSEDEAFRIETKSIQCRLDFRKFLVLFCSCN